ncbi:MAG: hypothetical protein AAF805_13220, partial [Planctomycetota bacterium]
MRLASVVAPIAARAAGDRLLIESAEAISDVGKLSVSGSIGVADVDRWSSGVNALPSDLRVRGDVELAALGRSAPGALAIRDGSRIEAGRVTADVRMNDGRVEAAADLAGLAGVAGGRRVAWDQPVSLRVRATHSIAPGVAAPWRLDSLTLDSRFASATATGEGDTLTGELRADLDRLAAELRPLFDLGATRLAGQGSANYRVRRDPASGAWALDAQGSVERLLVGDAERPLVDEPRLDVRAKVSGPATSAGPADISGRIDVTAGADLLVIEAPTASNGSAAREFTATLSGDAARWYRRVRVARPDLPAGEAIGLAGAVRVEARGEASPDRAQVDRLSVALSGLTLDTASVAGAPRVRLRDERVELGGAARWDAASGAVRLRDAELVSSVASARVGEAMLSINDPPSSRGEAAFRVDLAGVNRWTPPRAGPPTHAASGSVTGTATLRGVPEGLNILAAATGENLTLTRLAPRGSPTGGTPPNGSMVVWSEPSLRVDLNAIATPIAAAGGRPATVSVEVRDVRVASQTLSGSAGGKIEDAVGLRGVRLGGGVDYDLAMVTALLAPRTGGAVKLAGRDRATFRIESVDDAPADAPPVTRLTGEFAAPWEGAEVFGLPIGPGRLAATLEGGVVRTDPLAVAVGQGGRIDLAALARLHPVPGSVSLRPGPLVSDVALSAEVTERVLKFIAPVLADATRIDGRFSLGLEEFVAPLSPPDPRDPRSTALATRAAGALDIQSVRVLPGPGVAEWVALVDQIRRTAEEGVEAIASVGERPLVEIRQSRVPFRMVNGRIEHTGLEFAIGDAVV